MIKIGSRINEQNVEYLKAGEYVTADINDVLSGQTVVLVGIPGAFTSVCTIGQMPSYIRQVKEFTDLGVDQVICMSLNDSSVLKSWQQVIDPDCNLNYIADGNGKLTESLDAKIDMSAMNMGIRSNRFVMIIRGGLVSWVSVEDRVKDVVKSSAQAVLDQLKADAAIC